MDRRVTVRGRGLESRDDFVSLPEKARERSSLTAVACIRWACQARLFNLDSNEANMVVNLAQSLTGRFEPCSINLKRAGRLSRFGTMIAQQAGIRFTQ